MTAAKTKQEIEFRSKIEELESKILKVIRHMIYCMQFLSMFV